jgi:hypothetical protein
MEERPFFKDEIDEDEAESEGRTVAFYSPYGGPQYQEFSLYLPIGSNVSRSEDNTIEIKSKDLDILMSVRFEGYGTALPDGFFENYLGRNDWLDSHIIGYKIGIDIQVEIKLRLLFSRKAWKDYHSWVDLYINELEEVSQDAFFDLIGWETAHTLIQCLKNNKTDPNIALTSLSQDLGSGNRPEK